MPGAGERSGVSAGLHGAGGSDLLPAEGMLLPESSVSALLLGASSCWLRFLLQGGASEHHFPIQARVSQCLLLKNLKARCEKSITFPSCSPFFSLILYQLYYALFYSMDS